MQEKFGFLKNFLYVCIKHTTKMTKSQTERLRQEEKRNRQETLRWMNGMNHRMSQIIYEFANGIENASEEYENEMFVLFLLRLKEQKLRSLIS